MGMSGRTPRRITQMRATRSWGGGAGRLAGPGLCSGGVLVVVTVVTAVYAAQRQLAAV
ncbi:hypothetical protein SAMN05421833_16010 [Microbispora rosea]|uniref:Uncharacterized protein n=1 Tax=Microbispora rosea TaxID=58117 RepID=A0A1N7HJT9_9ACTN|nr:hypothetical protein SAMN05421833_16010 [Microbispora rosea]